MFKEAKSKTKHKKEILIASSSFFIDCEDLLLQLWTDSHNSKVYHVRLHDFKNGKRIFWESFDSEKEALTLFYSKIKELDLNLNSFLK